MVYTLLIYYFPFVKTRCKFEQFKQVQTQSKYLVMRSLAGLAGQNFIFSRNIVLGSLSFANFEKKKLLYWKIFRAVQVNTIFKKDHMGHCCNLSSLVQLHLIRSTFVLHQRYLNACNFEPHFIFFFSFTNENGFISRKQHKVNSQDYL